MLSIEKDETMPSDCEWMIMEVLWESGAPLTSTEITNRLRGRSSMTVKMVRVLMNRLCRKGLSGFTVDGNNARIYHYSALKSKEECLKEKNQRYVNSYFSGNRISAVKSLLEGISLTGEQIMQLERILEKGRAMNTS